MFSVLLHSYRNTVVQIKNTIRKLTIVVNIIIYYNVRLQRINSVNRESVSLLKSSTLCSKPKFDFYSQFVIVSITIRVKNYEILPNYRMKTGYKTQIIHNLKLNVWKSTMTTYL